MVELKQLSSGKKLKTWKKVGIINWSTVEGGRRGRSVKRCVALSQKKGASPLGQREVVFRCGPKLPSSGLQDCRVYCPSWWVYPSSLRMTSVKRVMAWGSGGLCL